MESFGARLKREREQRKVTLDEISLSTKIGTRFLRALEEERFEQLPGGIFNKGFVRAYARHLGMDEEQAISDYLVASGTGQPEKKPEEAGELEARAEEDPQAAARIPWGIFAVVLLLVALGFALWGFHSREKSASPPVVTAPGNSKTSPPTHPNIGAQKPAASESSATATAAARTSPAESPAAAAPNSGPAPGAFVVLITARENSWLTITVDGKQIMNDTLVAPGEKSVAGQKEVVIRAGDVGALDFSFNGKKLPIQGDYDAVKTLVFDASGLRPTPAKTEPATGQTPQQ